MGRKTQITKEMILEAALQMLIRDGYASITVKNLASEIGCSTQPVVWHFKNMDGFWKAFYEYCIAYTKRQFTVWTGNVDELLAETARGYITIACNMPHLFRFVFMNKDADSNDFDAVKAQQMDNTEKIIEMLCEEKGVTRQQAASFLMNYEFYVHGVASYTAGGFCHYAEEEIVALANRAKDAFLACEMR